MAEMSKTFPEGLKYAIHYDTTKFIGQAIHTVYETLFEAGILVLIVIMVFLKIGAPCWSRPPPCR